MGDEPEDPKEMDAVLAELAEYPDLAAHERPRAPQQSRAKDPSRRRSLKAGGRLTLCKVSPHQRVRELGHPFVVDGKSLMCDVCKIVLTTKMSVIKTHTKSQRHLASLERSKNHAERTRNIEQSLCDYYEQHPGSEGSALDVQTLTFRYKTVEGALAAGIVLEKLSYLSPVLETRHSLGSLNHLRHFVPKILKNELDTLMTEISKRFLSVSFDGTTRLGEASNFVVRFTSDDWQIVKRLSKFLTTLKSLTGEKLAAVLIRHLLTELHLSPNMLVAMPRDSCPVNGVAVRRAKTFYPSAVDILCISHILNCCGAHFETRVLGRFTSLHVTLIGMSHAALTLWGSLCHEDPCRYSAVRWHCTAEIQFQMARNVDQIVPFVRECKARGIGDKTVEKMQELLASHLPQLRAELAVTLDMEPLVKTTYELEGDRLEVLIAYDRIEALRELGRTFGDPGTVPNLDAFIRAETKLGADQKIMKHFEGHGLCEGKLTGQTVTVDSTLFPGTEAMAHKVRYSDCVEELEEIEIRPLLILTNNPLRTEMLGVVNGMFRYIERRVTGDCNDNLSYASCHELYRLVRIFNPSRVAELDVTTTTIDELSVCLPTLDANGLIEDMKRDLHKYRSLAASCVIAESSINDITDKVLGWWRQHGATVGPPWCSAAKIVFALTPNSASCERVFSMLATMFPDSRTKCLADQIEASLKLRFNKRLV